MKKKEKYKVRTQILVQIGSRTWAMEVHTHTTCVNVHVMVTCLKRKWLWSFSLCKEDIFFLGYDDIHQQVMKWESNGFDIIISFEAAYFGMSQMSLFSPMLSWLNKGVETLIGDCYWHPHWCCHEMSSYGGSRNHAGSGGSSKLLELNVVKCDFSLHARMLVRLGSILDFRCDQRNLGSSSFGRS